MDFKKNEINEAARLTRQGRLVEATALIRRSLGLGSAPAHARGQVVVDVPQIDVTSISASEPAAPDLPPATGAEPHPESPVQNEIDRRTLTPLNRSDILGKLPARPIPAAVSGRGRRANRRALESRNVHGRSWQPCLQTLYSQRIPQRAPAVNRNAPRLHAERG